MAENGALPSTREGEPVSRAFDQASLTASRHLITAAGPASSNFVPVSVLEPITSTQPLREPDGTLNPIANNA